MNTIAMREAADLKEKEVIGLYLKAESAKVALTVAEKECRMSLGGSFAAASSFQVKMETAKEKVAEAEKNYDQAYDEYYTMWNAYIVALNVYQAEKAAADAKDLKKITVLLNEYEEAETTFSGAAAALGVEW